MSGILGIGGGGDTGFYPYTLNQSVRFNDDDSAYLTRTPSSDGNLDNWTFSAWTKLANADNGRYLIGASIATSKWFHIAVNTSGQIDIRQFNSSSYDFRKISDAVLRDVSAWYHIVVSYDSDDATAEDRIKVYVNGERITSFGTNENPSSGTDSYLNQNHAHTIGAFVNNNGSSVSNFYDGYLAEVNLVDGTTLLPTSFGETKAGIWVPIEYTGSYGTNGFRLTFEDDTTVEGFNTVLYDGNGSTKSVGGVGFEPDLVWVKNRDNTNNHRLVDSIRGAANDLQPNLTGTESNTSTRFQSFDSDGFTVGSNAEVNSSGHNMVAWCWDAGTGSAASNTDGSITSSVKANTARGFSIVTYTGTGSNATVGHGLGAAPTMIIVKKRTNDTQAWQVYHSGNTANPETDKLTLNTSAATVDDNTTWNDTAPTSSVFSIGTGSGTNESTDTYVAYCWTDITGYSKFGSYTGTGSAGKAITTGFKPAWIMIKRRDSANNWVILDTTRDADGDLTKYLAADSSQAESDSTQVKTQIDSTGFTLQSSQDIVNASSGEYVYMAFADTREYAFWTDQSGNNNDFQHTNLEHIDVVPDTPTNNFATLNSTNNAQGATLSEGNLRAANASATDKRYHSTFGMTTGKWYWEVRINTVGTRNLIGIWSDEDAVSTSVPDNYARLGVGNGSQNTSGTYNSGAVTASAGNILSFAFDADNGELYTKINGTPDTSSTASFTGLASDTYLAGVRETSTTVGNNTFNFGQDSSFAGLETAQGNSDDNGVGDFYYAPPSGYLALCAANLPDPDIDPNAGKTPDEYFDVATWSGTSANQVIPLEFPAEFIWAKSRGDAAGHALFDIARGTDAQISSHTNAAEVTGHNAVTSFSATGASLGADNTGTNNGRVNETGRNYVGWFWKAGGTAVSNTDGTVNSNVSANTEAGFSIVTFTGGAAGYTVGHGLSQAPEIVFTFNRTDSAGANYVFTTAIDGSIDYLNLDGTTAKNNDPFSMPAFTSSVFSLDNDYGMDTGDNCVAYCFHSVEGYSKIGSYVGNASTDGAFVYTGFRPAFVMCKRIGSTGAWPMFDNKRDVDNEVEHILQAHISNAELSPYDRMDFVSNGFKLRDTGSGVNNSDTILYMAFAEQPFKYANAR